MSAVVSATRLGVVATLIASALVTACGGGSGSSKESSGFGIYQYASGGGQVDFWFTRQAPPEAQADVADFEAVRNAAGASPVTYIFIKGDNTGGSEPLVIPYLQLVVDSGRTLRTKPVWSAVGDWDVNNDRIDLYNKWLHSDDKLLPGAKTVAFFVVPGRIATIESVFTRDFVVGEQQLFKKPQT